MCICGAFYSLLSVFSYNFISYAQLGGCTIYSIIPTSLYCCKDLKAESGTAVHTAKRVGNEKDHHQVLQLALEQLGGWGRGCG